VPLGTLNGDPDQYGGVPAWANAGVASATANNVPRAVTMAAIKAVSRSRGLAEVARPPGGLLRRDITCMLLLPDEVVRPPLYQGRWWPPPLARSGGREAAAASAEVLISTDMWSSGT
jgi:hypothetical protein